MILGTEKKIINNKPGGVFVKTLKDIEKIREDKRKELELRVNTKTDTREKHILVCHGTGCTSSKSPEILENFRKILKEKNIENVRVIKTGCFGLCAKGPIVIIRPEDTFYAMVTPDDCEEIIQTHIIEGKRVERLLCKDIDGTERTGEAFDYYEPYKKNEYVMFIVDHVSLLDTERGFTLRESINKLCEYLIIARNNYNYIPVVVQQQNIETIGLDAFKSNKIRPTLAGLADSKDTGKAVDVMLGITNPFSFEIPEYLGYNIKILKGNFRCLEIVLNRSGESNAICPLYFNGAVNFYKELPRPSDSIEIERIYREIENKKKNINNRVTLLAFVITNKLNKLFNHD